MFPLFQAASAGNNELVKVLVEAGAVVNQTMPDGKTPLDAARGNRNRGFTTLGRKAQTHECRRSSCCSATAPSQVRLSSRSPPTSPPSKRRGRTTRKTEQRKINDRESTRNRLGVLRVRGRAHRHHTDHSERAASRAKVVRRSKVLAYETMRDIARRMWDKPPFLLGGAQAQHGAVGSEVLIPGYSGTIRDPSR